jgi:hypothetical protein
VNTFLKKEIGKVMRAAAGIAVGLAIVGAVLLSLSRARSPAHTTILFDFPGALAEPVKKISW